MNAMIVKLLTEHHLEFLSSKGGCRGWAKSTHLKMPHCWKSHATARIYILKESSNAYSNRLRAKKGPAPPS